MLSVLLSALLPGLGHAYMGKLGRALIWLAGTLAIGLIVGQDAADRTVASVMIVVLAVFAALDISLLIHGDSGRGRL